MRFALIGMSVALVFIACRQSTEPPTTLSVSLQANTTVVPRGDTVTFHLNAAGNNLVGVTIDYGDEAMDQYATGGALSARVTFKHVYSNAGHYVVRATVTDAIAGDKEATVAIVVN